MPSGGRLVTEGERLESLPLFRANSRAKGVPRGRPSAPRRQPPAGAPRPHRSHTVHSIVQVQSQPPGHRLCLANQAIMWPTCPAQPHCRHATQTPWTGWWQYTHVTRCGAGASGGEGSLTASLRFLSLELCAGAGRRGEGGGGGGPRDGTGGPRWALRGQRWGRGGARARGAVRLSGGCRAERGPKRWRRAPLKRGGGSWTPPSQNGPEFWSAPKKSLALNGPAPEKFCGIGRNECSPIPEKRGWGSRGGGEGRGSRDALERGGGQPPPPHLQGAQPMPSHRLPDAKCQPQWHL